MCGQSSKSKVGPKKVNITQLDSATLAPLCENMMSSTKLEVHVFVIKKKQGMATYNIRVVNFADR